MPKYQQVNWDQAECQEFDTDLFYRVEEERNQDAYQYINAVRSICGRCPIQRECLAYAFGNEEFGVWGGLTGLERRSVGDPDRYPVQLKRALAALNSFGISFKEVKESYEHSVNVGSLANRFTNYRKDGAASNSRPRLR
jgi:WhiB family transcriptional regulator, redox-sensing transcriptional regulator